MEDTNSSASEKFNPKISKESLPPAQKHKKRKVAQKVIVTTVKMETTDKKQKKEGPPLDCWSWRKYGQKPIKGSPYPRGYYRCSTSKGCSAKKQVERCRTDPTVLIVTYTSTHNHATTVVASSDLVEKQKEKVMTPKQEEEKEESVKNEKLGGSEDPFRENIESENPCETYENITTTTTTSSYKSEENDFYDELEELPTSSFFSSFMRRNFFEERILVNPS
ncbi:hypothetical protein M9H77_05848 [Catharanthus roseus]|uniref:Uncharacterized protein n=1 Tax=Catharanthus roseus TaxID=4058 RepID=A0ACC0BQM4_CATRO|nr:hypothetical protein M9H77_05848 [Catharanthus roseus]